MESTSDDKEKKDDDSRAKKVIKAAVPHKIALQHTADDDTLVDVKVNNPLRRITQLLEEIKKQKAFSFTLKGSLGIAGIALVVTTFGIFGGTKAFCSKGTQSHIGVVKQLAITDGPERSYIMERALIVWYALTGKDFERRPRPRTVLIKNDQNVIQLKERVEGLSLASFLTPVIATGQYDSCSQTLSITDINGVQAAQ